MTSLLYYDYWREWTFPSQAFQKELVKRTSSVASVRESAKELLSQPSEESFVSNRLIDMTTKWDKVCRMSVRRQERLEDALQQVSHFTTYLHMAFIMLQSKVSNSEFEMSDKCAWTACYTKFAQQAWKCSLWVTDSAIYWTVHCSAQHFSNIKCCVFNSTVMMCLVIEALKLFSLFGFRRKISTAGLTGCLTGCRMLRGPCVTIATCCQTTMSCLCSWWMIMR